MDSRVDTVCRLIRQRIAEGVYRPAQRLVETELAKSFGVSRISVRFALHRLQQEGLVTIEPRRGATVRVLSLEEAVEIMEIRERLEGMAAELAAQRITDDDLAKLARLVEEMEDLLQQGKPMEYSQRNALFHQTIIEAAGHRVLSETLASLQTPLIRFRFRTILVPGRSEQSVKEHREILQALKAHSPREAEAAMRHHLANVRRTMVEAKDLLEIF
mgnify:CR=1 FL=1